MKKIIGILGVAVIAGTIFFNVNPVVESAKDLNLASLISLSTANAEDTTCLIAEVIEDDRHSQSGKKCYHDQTGPDIFEGYVKTCYVDPNTTCQPLRCSSVPNNNCYTVD